jgi:hypothetical protein
LHHSDGTFAAVAFDRRAALKALIASFSVYLLPIFTVHITFLWGWAIGAEILAGQSGRAPLWLAADVALAFVLQGLAFALFYWIFSARGRGGRWRWFALVAAVPVFEAALIWAYLLAIPAVFLIEGETATEIGDWPTVCRIEDATLVPVRGPAVPDLARAQEAWIGSATLLGNWRLMTGTDCHLEAMKFDRPAERGSLAAVAAGGAAIFTSHGGDPPVSRYWHLDPVSGAATQLTPPEDAKYWKLSLSRDGKAVGWIERERSGQYWKLSVKTREIATGRERSVVLADLDRGDPEILTLDGFEGGVMVALYPGRVLAFDGAGALAWGPIDTGEIKHVGQYFLRIGDGWVAWEIYRDEGREQILWDLPQGAGRHEVPLGSSITDLAVSPDGALIVVSTSTGLSIGSVRDSLFAFRTRDGAEVYRRYFGKYTRTRMAFLGARHLAVTRVDLKQGGGWIDLLQIPDGAADP